MSIEPMTSAHADAVLAIYQAGIEEGNATFETSAPGWAVFSAARLPGHRFVAAIGGQVTGWVAASAVSGRCVYAGVVEHSVYVHPAARTQGTGRRLLDALIASTEAAGIWTIQSGIFPENTASLALHRAAGFRAVGTRERIGQHHGRWRDVILIEQGIQRGRADAPGRARQANGSVPDTSHGDSQQDHHCHQRHAGNDPGRHRDRPAPRTAGDERYRPAQPHYWPGCQQPSGGPAPWMRPGELRHDHIRSAELRHGGRRCLLRSQAQAQVPPPGLLQPVRQFLHHRAGQLPGQRVQVSLQRLGPHR